MTRYCDTLSNDDRMYLRQEANRILGQLQDEVNLLNSPPPSWILGDNNNHEQSPQCRLFNHAGFLLVPQFAEAEECAAMKKHMANLVDKYWNPWGDESTVETFGTTKEENQQRGDYFLESADRIHYFAEPDALEFKDDLEVSPSNDEKPKMESRPQLKASFRNQKMNGLNKAGHALHREEGSPFTNYCKSEKIRHLVMDVLQWRNPVVPQSMYIFKGAQVGGAVHAHQDSTFLFTDPQQSCLGLWLALDEATLDNGCLWVRPRSHLEPVRRQFKRNPQHFGDRAIDQRSNEAGADFSQDKFVMEYLVQQQQQQQQTPDPDKDVLPLESTTLQDLLDKGFVPVECQAGDLLVFCGTLEHLSLPNHSNQPRHTFQLHLVEGPPFVEWSKYNWLQYPTNQPFLTLADPENAAAPAGQQ